MRTGAMTPRSQSGFRARLQLAAHPFAFVPNEATVIRDNNYSFVATEYPIPHKFV